MKTVHVRAAREYDIHIGGGLMHKTGEIVAGIRKPCKIALLTDDQVAPLYHESVEASLSNAGFQTCSLILPHGEGAKSIQTLENILEFLCCHEFTRADVVVALGGGVIGDAAGFAASVYLRGVAYIQMPTSLLAMVDSSVGGKTAVNLKAGKNLAGSFWQPELVICDTEALRSLPEGVVADGVAEAVKYGMIGDKPLFETLQRGLPMKRIDDIVAQCVAMKAEFVREDEFDEGSRQLLNFGHTVGHAIEVCSGYAIRHGHAVGIGMAIMARAAEKRELCEKGCTLALLEALRHNNLPHSCEFSASELAQAAMSDKKRRGGSITLILPKAVGRCDRYPLPVEKLESFLQDGLS